MSASLVELKKEFLDTFNLQETDLSKKQMEDVHKFILRYKDIFSQGEFDIGYTTTVKHRIDLMG